MAETLARSLIRLLVTVGILAAVYLFLIRPILDTTNDTIDRAFEPFDGITENLEQTFDDAGIGGVDVESGSAKEAQRLLACVKRVQPNTTRMQACAERFQ